MRKNVFGRKFKRDANERKALFKSLISALVLNGSIKTTLEKAKSIKGDVDKIVNKAKKGGKKALYLLQSSLNSKEVKKIIDIVPMFSDRNSGYTKMTKLGRRFSDNASMVLMEWAVKAQNSNVKTQSSDVKELTAGKIENKASVKKETAKPKTKRKGANK